MSNLTTELRQSIRENSTNIPKEVNGLFPVIVESTMRSANVTYFGIQFWTNDQVQQGVLRNSDNTTSTYVERLYP